MAENTKILLNKSDLLEVYPQKGETKSDFINRFMRVTGSEYPDVKQRYAVANSYWERRNKKGLNESDHTQKAIDALGITYYKTRAGFMLKDGRLLDLTYGGNPREDHRAIQDAFDDMDLETGSDYLIEFMNEGNIRLIPELPGIDITMPPTHEQWLALKDYIQYWINRKHHFEIQFSNEIGQQVDWKEFNGFTSINEILYTIADHFGLKLIESIEPHQNDKTYSKYIINPEENYDLASKITPIINNHQNIVPMKRDHCLEINRDLLFDLKNAGYKFELVSGYFICDNVNITDLYDLKTLKKYNEYKQSGLSIPEFVTKNNYLGKEKGWFTYIPHWWLQLGGLIVDMAWPMFKKALEKPITAENYTVKDFNESFVLHEDTRAQLIAKSRNTDLYKNQTHGKNRFERKKYSKVASQVKSFNQIDMNKFFKQDILEVNIPVVGETDTYTVTIRLDGVVAEIAKNIKANNNKFEFRTVVQALTKVFNSSNNVRVKCTCADFKYRYAHSLILNNNSVDGTDKDPGPGKTGMANTQGKGCKHILLVLNNQAWLMKVVSVLHNYVNYSQEHMQKAFLKIIFPKLYGIPADAAIEENLVPEDTNLDTEKHIIDVINDWAKNRGKYKKGENRNPINDKRNKKEGD